MGRFRGYDDLEIIIAVVFCFAVFLIALLLLAIAPRERAAACAFAITENTSSTPSRNCADFNLETPH